MNGRDLIFRRPVDFSSRKSSRKECFAPYHFVRGENAYLGGSMERHRHVVRSTLCELFRFFCASAPMREKSSLGLPEAFGGLLRPSEDFLKLFLEKIIFLFFSCFMKVQHQTWGGRWSAIDVLCEALFGELFRIFRAPDSMRKKSSRGLPEASGGLQGPSGGFLRLFQEK